MSRRKTRRTTGWMQNPVSVYLDISQTYFKGKLTINNDKRSDFDFAIVNSPYL